MESVRKPYTKTPISDSTAFKREKFLWEPMLLVRVGLPKRSQSPRFPAYVDSGSPFCIFRADLGELIGIRVEKGEEDTIGGIIAGVREPIYFHRINLYVETDWVIPIRAGFMKKLHTHGILGRDGFFDNFHVHFDHSSTPPAVEITRIEKLH